MNATQETQENGWKTGTYAQFLGMTPAEEAIVEIKGVLSDLLIEAREARGWTQKDLAERLNTKQAGVARLESGVGPVSIDLIVRALVAVGVSLREIAKAIEEIELSVSEASVPEVASQQITSQQVTPRHAVARVKDARVRTRTPARLAKPAVKSRVAKPRVAKPRTEALA